MEFLRKNKYRCVIIILLLSIVTGANPQRKSKQSHSFQFGKLKVHFLFKEQENLNRRLRGENDSVRIGTMVYNSLYLQDSLLRSRFTGDSASFINLYIKKMLRDTSLYQGDEELELVMRNIVTNFRKLTSENPQGDWYILKDPKWMDMGGVGLGIMIIDLNHPSNADKKHIELFLPHELNHQVYENTNDSDLDGETVLYRIINEGFATCVNQLYWGKKYTTAENLMYTEEELNWCRENEQKILDSAGRFLLSVSRKDKTLFASRDKSFFKPGPAAIGYYIGYRICEEFVRKNGKDSWKRIYKMPVRKLAKESGLFNL